MGPFQSLLSLLLCGSPWGPNDSKQIVDKSL
uniref:Uncharacterized protein n=1 Tax=Anguilla anguilla TaxID=7936 RepID=A0A0E9V257_ANGAN